MQGLMPVLSYKLNLPLVQAWVSYFKLQFSTEFSSLSEHECAFPSGFTQLLLSVLKCTENSGQEM